MGELYAPPYNRAVRIALLLALLWLGLPLFARADIAGVEVALTGGEVVGHTRGLGTASVIAQVRNTSERTLEGLRIASWYSPADVLPPADAQWRIHEFVFDPPLKPGASSSLSFTDDSAAQYVLLEARQAKFTPALKFGGVVSELSFPLLRQDGAAYVALRDLVDVTGGGLSSAGGFIIVEREGRRAQLKLGSTEATVDGSSRHLQHPLLDSGGRGYIALADAAAVLKLALTDLGYDLFELKGK